MLITKKLKVKWHSTTRKHYVEKGYIFTKFRDEFEIDIKDINPTSIQLVEYICDYCNGENQIEEKHKLRQYYVYIQLRKDNKDCCYKCKGKKTSETNISKPILDDRTLSHNFPDLIEEWSKKNKKSPLEFTSKSHQRVQWECKEGHEWEAKISNRTVLGRGCPYCSGRNPSEDDNLAVNFPELLDEWDYVKNDSLKPDMVKSKTIKKVWWVCKEGHEWKTSISNRTSKNRTGCPICNESKGEKKVREFLVQNKINYTHQYEFNDLRGVYNKCLKFDFAIWNNHNDLQCLIEFDGQFHFNKVYNDDGFEICQIHDKRKDEYCKMKEIELLRIPYWELERIDEILYKRLIN